VESTEPLPPSLCVRIVSAINLLASQNPSKVRTRMKELGIFDIRDNVVLHCIRDDMSDAMRLEAFRAISFEVVAVCTHCHCNTITLTL
jgi:hypothetical protein